MKRFLIAFDLNAPEKCQIYLRETLCVTHDGNVGEVVYHAKPKSLTARRINTAIKLLNKVMSGQQK